MGGLEASVFGHKVLEALKLSHRTDNRPLLEEKVQTAEVGRQGDKDLASKASIDGTQRKERLGIEVTDDYGEQIPVDKKPR